ncbi:MAG: hypothetical protein CMF12_10025 [Idiomarina sp.]|nr:hypothetical protein [Idiomarina sp.]
MTSSARRRLRRLAGQRVLRRALPGGSRFAEPCPAALRALQLNTVTCACGARRFAAPQARAQFLTSAGRRAKQAGEARAKQGTAKPVPPGKLPQAAPSVGRAECATYCK